MKQEKPTCIRVQKGADNAKIHDCVLVTPSDSERSLVDTKARNTRVSRSRIIEIPKSIARMTMKHKIIWFIIVPLAIAVIAGLSVVALEVPVDRLFK